MSFSDFKTLSQVQQAYQIHYQESPFIPKQTAILPTAFVEDLTFNINQLDVFSSEAARCELIILPILREVYKKFAAQFSLWVQKPMNYTPELSGTPDYMVSKRSHLGKTVLEFPLLMLVEAKKNDFEQGWAQCLAELWAAQHLNQQPDLAVYGIVSDGKYWEFGKLQQQRFIKNNQSFSIDDLPELVAALEFIFEKASHA
jgi:hypothetical protein